MIDKLLFKLPSTKLVSSKKIDSIVLEDSFVIAEVILALQPYSFKTLTTGVLVEAHAIGPAPLPCRMP